MLQNIVLIGLICGLTAVAAHRSRVVFNDGVRPIMPEFSAGHIGRGEMAKIAGGLGSGYFFSVGITFALISKLLNPWLLFLPTDIIGILAKRTGLAALIGFLWGSGVTLLFAGIHTALDAMPLPFADTFQELYRPVLLAISIVPALAAYYQFGKLKGAAVLVLSLVGRQLSAMGQVPSLLHAAAPETLQLAVGLVLFLILVIAESRQAGKTAEISEGDTEDGHAEQTSRLTRSLPLLMAIGGLVALAAKMHVFAGTEAASALLPTVFAGDSGNASAAVAIADGLRHLAFLPFIITSAFASGVYTVVVMSPLGYLAAPSWFGTGLGGSIGAFALGALEMAVVVLAGRSIVRQLERFPVLREAADHIRNAWNQAVEIGLTIGSAIAAASMASSSSEPFNGFAFTVFAALFLINEAMGRPVVRLAAAPAAAVAAGLAVNLFYVFGLQ